MPLTPFTLRPNGQGADTAFTLIAGATKPIAASDQSDATYSEPPGAGTFETYTFADIPAPGGSLVSALTLHARVYGTGDWGFRGTLDGVNLNSVVNTFNVGAAAFFDLSVVQAKPTGGAWTVRDVNEFRGGGQFNWPGATPRLVEVWITGFYDPIPLELERVRVLATMRLLARRQPRALVRINGPFLLADVEPMSLLPWSHRAAPSADGLGWGELEWQRRPTRPLALTIDPNKMTVSVVAEDVRRQLLMMYDEGRSFISGASIADGIGRVYVGTRTYNRDSKAWVADPSNGEVRELGYDIEKISGDEFSGMLLEHQSGNQLLRSSFISGTTGLTIVGDGVNGSAVAGTANFPLFETAVTAFSLEILSGSPHAADLVVLWPTTGTIPADSLCRVSIDHKDDATAQLYWGVRRNFDNNYWNDATQAWQATVPNNVIPISTVTARFISSRIDLGANASTMTFFVFNLAGGTAGRVNLAHHVQLEALPWATSRMVNDATGMTRLGETLTYTNNSGARNWPSTGWTVTFEFISQWTVADITGAFAPIIVEFFRVSHDANNYIRMYHSGVTPGFLEMEICVAGVSSFATAPISPVRGTPIRVGARLVSTSGEHGLAAYTSSVFVDGVKGTDAVAAGFPTEAANSTITVGGGGASLPPVSGVIRRWRVTQLVLSDTEIARQT